MNTQIEHFNMAKTKKRNREDFESEGSRNDMGLGTALSALRPENLALVDTASKSEGEDDSQSPEGEWQVVKRRKGPAAATEGSKYPRISHSTNSRLLKGVKISDLQSLVLYILASGPAPQWIAVQGKVGIRKTVVLLVPGLEMGFFDGTISLQHQSATTEQSKTEIEKTSAPLNEYGKIINPDDYYPVPLLSAKLPDVLKPLADIFEHVWPIQSPGDSKYSKLHSPMQAILHVALPISKDENSAQKGPRKPRYANGWVDDPKPITHFIATISQLQDDEYATHELLLPTEAEKQIERENRKSKHKTFSDGWLDADIDDLEACNVAPDKIPKGSMTAGRTVLCLDCEMCETDPDQYDLTRISIVDWDGTVIMDELVKPAKAITNYLTQYSGITKAKLENVTTTLEDIQSRVLALLKNHTILVGHSLVSDLNALKITHPFIVDTSIMYPHPRGPPLKSSLKFLSQKYLGRAIQSGSSGHDSIEDARAALDLVKMKCQKGSEWGTSEASNESIFKRLARSPRPTGIEGPSCLGAVVDWGVPKRGYGALANVSIGCENDEDVVKGIRRAVLGDQDGKEVVGAGVDFVYARMRGLEAKRGWWNSSKTADNDALRESAKSEVSDGNVDGTAVAETVSRIKEVYNSLPPCTALIVYSGSGNPRGLGRMQVLQQQFKREYATKKWDELSVKWTDDEEQALKAACRTARSGLGFVTVK